MSTAPQFTPAQLEQLYTVFLDSYKLRHYKGTEFRSICPLHGGSNPSQFLVDFADGHYHCFACNAGGRKSKPFFFVMEMVKRELGRSPTSDETQARIEQILGEPMVKRVYRQTLSQVREGGWDRKQARVRYLYADETGVEVASCWRFVDHAGNKKVVPDRPCPFCTKKTNLDAECPYKCDGGRIWGLSAREDGLKAVERTLYRLPDLMASTVCFVVEGERNVDDLSRALGAHIKAKGGIEHGPLVLDRIAVVTNIGGANGWKKEYRYARDFWRKTVIVLRDNDAAGLLHQQAVCEDVATYAREVRTLELPGMGESEDISDYLERHTIEDFLALLPTSVVYSDRNKLPEVVHQKPDEQRILLVKPSKLLRPEDAHGRDWLVPGLIARGKRGLVVARPKVGKSLLFCDLALCLGANQGFLGGPRYGKPVRTAIISREDGPDEVYFRLKALGAGRGLSWEEIDRNISVNTREQSSRFNIDNTADLKEMAAWLKADGAEFAVFDVLNKLHGAESNSSSDMTRIMQNFDDLAYLSGAQVAVIHHTNKTGGAMGSTSIEGWADYIMQLDPHADDDSLKTLSLRTKSSSSIPPRTLRYWQSEDKEQSSIQMVQARPVSVVPRRSSEDGRSRASGY